MLQIGQRKMKAEKGSTLIELLVVICIVAILATIAIPTYLGQRHKAQDTAAKSLVHGAMTTIECGYVDGSTFDPSDKTMEPKALQRIEPSITFEVLAEAAVAKDPADAAHNAVSYTGDKTTYEVACQSASGKTFGIRVDMAGSDGTQSFVDGKATEWQWQQADTSTDETIIVSPKTPPKAKPISPVETVRIRSR